MSQQIKLRQAKGGETWSVRCIVCRHEQTMLDKESAFALRDEHARSAEHKDNRVARREQRREAEEVLTCAIIR